MYAKKSIITISFLVNMIAGFHWNQCNYEQHKLSLICDWSNIVFDHMQLFWEQKVFGDFQYVYCIQSRLQQFLEKLNVCKCVVFPHSHNKTTKKAYIYSLIRTHYLHIYSYQYRNECTNETKEDYCFNYCYGQTSGALTTLALENNCTHWNS